MDPSISTAIENIHAKDRELQNQSFIALLIATEEPVDWAYETWDGLVADLRHSDNRVRAISAQLLCNLAKSDPEKRMLKDFDALLQITKDERFAIARHCLKSFWYVGIAGKEQQEIFIQGMERRFAECGTEKKGTLIRSEILQSLRNVYEGMKDEAIQEKALALIETEPDEKYRKRYASLWRKK